MTRKWSGGARGWASVVEAWAEDAWVERERSGPRGKGTWPAHGVREKRAGGEVLGCRKREGGRGPGKGLGFPSLSLLLIIFPFLFLTQTQAK